MVDFNIGSAAFYNVAVNGSGESALITAIDDNDVLSDADGVLNSGEQFTLPASFPNPFAPGTTIDFTITFEYAGTIMLGGTTFPVFQQVGTTGNATIDGLFPSGVYGIISNLEQPFLDPLLPPTINFATDVTAETFPICFLPGTAIDTPTGTRPVEQLEIGDDILTADGATVPVKWVGKQTVSTRFGPAARLRPVRISADAFGDELPLRDLCLTADHALLLDGVLVNAGMLVNGDSIDWMALDQFDGSYTVYHIETEAHDVILAEGVPAETYIDYVARRAFDNYAEYLDLYGEDRTIPEMTYQRVSSARMLPRALKARLGLSDAA